MHYYLVIIAVVALDQFTKFLVTASLASAQSASAGITVIPGVFEILYVCNTGAAFNILQERRLFLIIMTTILILALLVFILLRRRKERAILLFAMALIAGGGMGNLIDRIRLGAVVDYLAFWSFPVFNLADITVCTGCGLAILHYVLLEKKARKLRRDEMGILAGADGVNEIDKLAEADEADGTERLAKADGADKTDRLAEADKTDAIDEIDRIAKTAEIDEIIE